MKDKFLKFVNSTKAKAAMVSATVMTALPQIASATGGGDIGTVNPKNNSAASIVSTIIGKVVQIFPLVGVFFIAAGAFKLIMAYRNDQPEAQTAAAKDIVIGAVFVVFSVFMWKPISDAIF